MRVLVCGSRTFSDKEYLFKCLDEIKSRFIFDVLIEGEASGADSLAREWAELNHIPVLKFPANWKLYGRAAGPTRNRQMIKEGKPDAVIAFLDKPLSESKGTKNMLTQSKKASLIIEIRELRVDTDE